MTMDTTIAAIATPPGSGGIAVVRVSGPKAYMIAQKVFILNNKDKSLENARGYTAYYGGFLDDGLEFDDGIALCYRAPHSYTGEDVIEFSCHGGRLVSTTLLEACIKAGARPAAAGEFTRRALMNGKLNLTQAEAVMDLIGAETRQGMAAASMVLTGELHRRIERIKNDLIALAAHLAAVIDYPEEDVETLTLNAFRATVAMARDELIDWLDSYDRGMILRRGVRAAIVGSPNVGKSTLFNLLSGFERAIVTSVAGTTRDVVREQVRIGGAVLNLSDTAGLRDTPDLVEEEGIRRSYNEIEQASLVIAVFDGSSAITSQEINLAKMCLNKKALAIVNKSDLGTVIDLDLIRDYFTEIIIVNARSDKAKGQIEQSVINILQLGNLDVDAPLLSNQRQLFVVQGAKDALDRSDEALASGLAFDAAGVCLEEALSYLSELSGEHVSDSIIDKVFEAFCVGK